MERRRLGRTGRWVTSLGFGGIPLRDLSVDDAVTLVEAALEAGIDFFDTARSYGDSEQKMGKALRSRPKLRSSIAIATKSMERTKKTMIRDIESSVRTIGCEYIDLYQAHGVDTDEALDTVLSKEGALQALRRARSAGLVLHIGITGHNPKVLQRAILTGEFDTVQVPVNALDRLIFDAEGTVLPVARAHDVGVIAMKPLAGGALEARHALRYALSQDVTVAIPGIRDLSQLQAAIGVAKTLTPLSKDELDALIQSAKSLDEDICRQCGYCMPCTQDINIREIFRLVGMHGRYEQKEEATRLYRALQSDASECIDCGDCEKRCPYKLAIRDKLKKAHETLRPKCLSSECGLFTFGARASP